MLAAAWLWEAERPSWGFEERLGYKGERAEQPLYQLNTIPPGLYLRTGYHPVGSGRLAVLTQLGLKTPASRSRVLVSVK